MLIGKGKILLAGVALTLAIPLVAFAADAPETSQEAAKEFGKRIFASLEGKEFTGKHRMMKRNPNFLDENLEMTEEFKAKMEEMRENFANGEFNDRGFAKGKFNHRGMMSQIPDELKTTLDTLRRQFENNEISQEELREQVHALMQEFRELKFQEKQQLENSSSELEPTNAVYQQQI